MLDEPSFVEVDFPSEDFASQSFCFSNETTPRVNWIFDFMSVSAFNLRSSVAFSSIASSVSEYEVGNEAEAAKIPPSLVLAPKIEGRQLHDIEVLGRLEPELKRTSTFSCVLF
mmetsp:Transcript_8937/g.17277  ORF Transcript_8937/g.17277 Transcript_8937/m.17277 type:complete len:113 (-) Transcript_8937:1435-1773(-)